MQELKHGTRYEFRGDSKDRQGIMLCGETRGQDMHGNAKRKWTHLSGPRKGMEVEIPDTALPHLHRAWACMTCGRYHSRHHGFVKFETENPPTAKQVTPVECTGCICKKREIC